VHVVWCMWSGACGLVHVVWCMWSLHLCLPPNTRPATPQSQVRPPAGQLAGRRRGGPCPSREKPSARRPRARPAPPRHGRARPHPEPARPGLGDGVVAVPLALQRPRAGRAYGRRARPGRRSAVPTHTPTGRSRKCARRFPSQFSRWRSRSWDPVACTTARKVGRALPR